MRAGVFTTIAGRSIMHRNETTLADILENRKFNCVSASVVYNLVAERASLPAS